MIKATFMNYTSPQYRTSRGIVGFDGFLYPWIATTCNGKEIDVIAFIERGWKPVCVLRHSKYLVWWEFTDVLRRENAHTNEEIKLSPTYPTPSWLDSRLEVLVAAKRVTLPKEKFEEERERKIKIKQTIYKHK